MAARPQRPRLLVVDDEEEILWTIEQRLAKERYDLLTAADGLGAMELLSREHVDVLVADIRMPRMNGVDLVLAARRARPDLPVIVMSAYPTSGVLAELAAKGSIHYLEKPFEFSHFLDTVERARATQARGFTGAISVQMLPDVVQLYALASTCGALHVACDGDEGVIWFERGTIPHAVTRDLVGEPAFHRVLGWSGGTFFMRLGESPPSRTISTGWTELVLESCRLLDERATPNLSTESPAPPTNTENPTMANYKEALTKLETLEGFIGGCLCDSESGMVLGTIGGNASLNLEVAGAANSEVVRAKRKAAKALGLNDTIEDILISLTKQYHLIRPLKSKPSVFFYVALDRARANLGMARLTLADIERDVVL